MPDTHNKRRVRRQLTAQTSSGLTPHPRDGAVDVTTLWFVTGGVILAAFRDRRADRGQPAVRRYAAGSNLRIEPKPSSPTPGRGGGKDRR